jgi:glycosyltransferase involved in cell wall biosynthesis
MAEAMVLVDEIWTPSTFSLRAIEPVVDRPVHLFPHPVVTPKVDPEFDVVSAGLTGSFNFLATYDFLSSFERKNPLGAITAFSRAFRPGEGPVLVLKSVNGSRFSPQLEQVRIAAEERPDIVILDKYLESEERAALIAGCDCYVSLHRSEGFGLGMAEAMSFGRPVIATAYSGNLDFMDEETAYLVPADRVPVGPDASPYDPLANWADPDLDAAAAFMRRVYEDRQGANQRGRHGQAVILDRFGMEVATRFLTKRLKEINKLQRRGYVSGVPAAVAAWL